MSITLDVRVAFLVPDSCRATIRNGNNISTDVTEDIIHFFTLRDKQ